MAHADILAFWSAVALALRVIAIVVFVIVLIRQVRDYKLKELYARENYLKRLLFAFVFVIALSNVPIMYLHYVRIHGAVASAGVTSFATVTNAASMVVIAAILWMIYGFRSKDL